MYERDREILLSPTGLLTNDIIDTAQMLLRQAFLNLSGLQRLWTDDELDIEPREFVQIIDNGNW